MQKAILDAPQLALLQRLPLSQRAISWQLWRHQFTWFAIAAATTGMLTPRVPLALNAFVLPLFPAVIAISMLPVTLKESLAFIAQGQGLLAAIYLMFILWRTRPAALAKPARETWHLSAA